MRAPALAFGLLRGESAGAQFKDAIGDKLGGLGAMFGQK